MRPATGETADDAEVREKRVNAGSAKMRTARLSGTFAAGSGGKVKR